MRLSWVLIFLAVELSFFLDKLNVYSAGMNYVDWKSIWNKARCQAPGIPSENFPQKIET
jgi:hypothetical protein